MKPLGLTLMASAMVALALAGCPQPLTDQTADTAGLDAPNTTTGSQEAAIESEDTLPADVAGTPARRGPDVSDDDPPVIYAVEASDGEEAEEEQPEPTAAAPYDPVPPSNVVSTDPSEDDENEEPPVDTTPPKEDPVPPSDNPVPPSQSDPPPSNAGPGQVAATDADVENVALGVAEVCSAFGLLGPWGDARINIAKEQEIRFGECPEVVFLSAQEGGIHLLRYTAEGCQSPATAWKYMRGELCGTVRLADGEGELEFTHKGALHAYIGDQKIDGKIHCYFVDLLEGLAFTNASFEMQFTPGGTTTGSADLLATREGTVVIESGRWELESNDVDYDLDITGLLIDPLNATSFTPIDGSIAFSDRVIEFTEESPVNGAVWVTTAGGSPELVVIPGLAE